MRKVTLSMAACVAFGTLFLAGIAASWFLRGIAGNEFIRSMADCSIALGTFFSGIFWAVFVGVAEENGRSNSTTELIEEMVVPWVVFCLGVEGIMMAWRYYDKYHDGFVVVGMFFAGILAGAVLVFFSALFGGILGYALWKAMVGVNSYSHSVSRHFR